MKIPILQLINIFPQSKAIYSDNEKSLNSETIRTILDKFDVNIVNGPPLHSKSNGQVERLHSTLGKIARCLKLENQIIDTNDLILQATVEYNRSIHSTTKIKPIDILLNLMGRSNDSIVLKGK